MLAINTRFFSNTKPTRSTKSDAVFSYGDTPLHQAMLDSESVSELQDAIDKIDKDKASVYARTVNDVGHLPMDLTPFFDDIVAVRQIIYPLTMQFSCKPISEPVSFHQVCADYMPSPNSDLYRNLKLACDVANIARCSLTQSVSHPSSNGLQSKYWGALHSRITSFREESDVSAIKFLESCPSYEITEATAVFYLNLFYLKRPVVFLSKEQGEKFLKLYTERYVQESIGNCHEFSHLALRYFLEKSNYKIAAATFILRNGSHVVLAIDPASPDAVICDAWAGKVFPKSEASTNLMALRYHHHIDQHDSSRYNAIPVSFNPHYHTVSIDVAFSPKAKQKDITPAKFPQQFGLCAVSKKHEASVDHVQSSSSNTAVNARKAN